MYELNISGHIPSINTMYVRFMIKGIVRTVLSKEGKKFKSGFKEAILEQNFVILQDKVKVDITLTFPDNRARDIDNYSKSLLDCLTGTIIKDDSQIYELHITKQIIKGESSTKLKIETLIYP